MEHRREDYRSSSYLIQHIDLEFWLKPLETQVVSTLFLKKTTEKETVDLILDGKDLLLKSITLNDKILTGKKEYELLEDERLLIKKNLLINNDIIKVTTIVVIAPELNTQLMGLYKSDLMLCTQCEAEGFRRITYYLDRPDIMATYTTSLVGPYGIYPVILCNGNLIYDEIREAKTENEKSFFGIDEKLHYVKYEDPYPKPSYLFALVAGDLDSLSGEFITKSKKNVKINLWCEPQCKEKLDWALQCVLKAMKWDEDRFNLEYDLDTYHIVAVSHFNMGAMENKGLNLFNSAVLLASPETASDLDYQRISLVVAHEYFHNWTGNRVTCRDWFQLTLKEGLTVFREQEFSMDMWSASVQRIKEIISLTAQQFLEDAGPLSHPIRPNSYREIDNFYTATVYSKGAEVIRLYQTILGKEGFKKGLSLYLQRHDGHAVTCDDFRQAMADANNKDFSQFEVWYEQSGTPIITVESEVYDKDNRTYKLCLSQTTPATPKEPFKKSLHIPVAIGLLGRKTQKEIIPTTVLELINKEQEFLFANINEEPILSILRNFSAPVILNYDRSDKDLAFLMTHDTDEVNRWDAGQRLMSKIIIDAAKSISEEEKNKPNMSGTVFELVKNSFLNYFEKIKNINIDFGFLVCCLTPPNKDKLLLEYQFNDPPALQIAVETFRTCIREACYLPMKKTYEELTIQLNNLKKSDQLSKEIMGIRAFRNLLLWYLTNETNLDIAVNHYKGIFMGIEIPQNMTDHLAALSSLVNYSSPLTTEMLENFLQTGKGDELIIHKWFTLQARADNEFVIKNVRLLSQNKLFDKTNPNCFRALVGGFCSNLKYFHHKSGDGYKFVADMLIEVDKINGIMAASTIKSLISFKQLKKHNKELQIKELERIAAISSLSTNTREVVTAALAQK